MNSEHSEPESHDLPAGLGEIHSSRCDPDAVTVVERLLRHGHRAYLVGGCVRDLLLRHSPKDFDVATEATPRQVKKIFRNSRIIGRRFRLVHVHFPSTGRTGGRGRGDAGKVIEVSTFRRDPRPGNGDSDEEPEQALDDDLLITRDNVFGTEREDALRRDFTINGLFYDVEHEEVIDYVGGVPDLGRGVLRTIGDAVQRVREDPVRILRAIKFVTRLDLTLEGDLAAAMAEHHEDLARSAPPRVFEELQRLLHGPHPERAVKMLASYGVLRLLVPELGLLPPSASDEDDRLHRLVDRLRAYAQLRTEEPQSTAMLLALLFHDEAGNILRHEDGGQALSSLEDFLRPLATRYRIARRDLAQWRSSLLVYKRIDRETFAVRKRRRRRAPLQEIMRRSTFRDALMLYRVVVEAEGRDPKLLLEWEERWREAVDSPTAQGGGSSHGSRARQGRSQGASSR